MGSYGPIWAPYGPIWTHMDPIWVHMGPYGPIWCPYGPCGILIIPSPVGLRGLFKICIRLSGIRRECRRNVRIIRHSNVLAPQLCLLRRRVSFLFLHASCLAMTTPFSGMCAKLQKELCTCVLFRLIVMDSVHVEHLGGPCMWNEIKNLGRNILTGGGDESYGESRSTTNNEKFEFIAPS